MIRGITVSGLMIGLMAAVLWLPSWLDSNRAGEADSQAGACDLQQSPCEWQHRGQTWQMTLSDISALAGTDNNYRLDIIAPGAPKPLLVVLRGESMYMGEYPVPLVRQGDRYYAEFAAPFCTTGDAMVWRVDLQQGMKPLDQAMPLKLTFQAG